MVSLTTRDIKISVRIKYNREQSAPVKNQYAYVYQVSIENLSKYSVQLLKRHWIIWDSNTKLREVEGDGVIGQQPIIETGKKHVYTSWCPLETELGKMEGQYLFRRLVDDELFWAQIPSFQLIADFVLN